MGGRFVHQYIESLNQVVFLKGACEGGFSNWGFGLEGLRHMSYLEYGIINPHLGDRCPCHPVSTSQDVNLFTHRDGLQITSSPLAFHSQPFKFQRKIN